MRNYHPNTMPNYSYIFNFESDFIHQKSRTWMQEHWTWGFYYVGAYMVFIFGVQHLMQNRPKFELRGTLCVWNTLLATFSIIGASRTLPELIHVIKEYGLYHSVCVPSYIEFNKVSGFWTFMFVLSKLPELGDTVFIVLRKQPLIFLHWYHHITVLLYSWFSYTEYTSSARWFIVMNYCVHSVMYTYYGLRAWGRAPPRQVAMVVTFMQLFQMIIGAWVNIKAYQFLQQGIECDVTPVNVKLSLAMYLSYFILFAKLFYTAYLSPKSKKRGAAHTVDSPLTKSKLH